MSKKREELTTALGILARINENVAAGCKKPLCYVVATIDKNGDPKAVRKMPVFWSKKACLQAARELSRLTDQRFFLAEGWIRTPKDGASAKTKVSYTVPKKG